MVTIDAPVFIAAAMPGELAHEAAATALARIAEAGLEVHEPAIALVEVTSGTARRTGDAALARQAGQVMLSMPRLTVHALDADGAVRAASLAADLHLRGADAVYAATALATGSTLLTLDTELVERAIPAVRVATPAAWLDGLEPDEA